MIRSFAVVLLGAAWMEAESGGGARLLALEGLLPLHDPKGSRP